MRVRNFGTLRPKPHPASWLIINSVRRVPDVQDVRWDSRQKSQGRKGRTPSSPHVRVERRQVAGVWDLQVVLITAATNVARWILNRRIIAGLRRIMLKTVDLSNNGCIVPHIAPAINDVFVRKQTSVCDRFLWDKSGLGTNGSRIGFRSSKI